MTTDIMKRTAEWARSAAEAPIVYSAAIEPMMREILQTLANIDFEHDMALEKLELSETDPAFKRKIAKRLDEQHQERRDPYVRLLAELHNRAMPRAALTH